MDGRRRKHTLAGEGLSAFDVDNAQERSLSREKQQVMRQAERLKRGYWETEMRGLEGLIHDCGSSWKRARL